MKRDAIALAGLLQNANVQAFLRVIRAGEGTSDEDGYRRHFGGRLFDSFSDHPRVAITAGLGRNQYTSTAAGAYQFLSRTWDGLVRQYGFADFAPRTQDIAALALIDGRRALDDVLAGRIQAAIRKCAPEWASLPGSPYGQPTKTLEQALATYSAAGGSTLPSPQPEPDRPTAAQPAPTAPVPAPSKESTMPAPILGAVAAAVAPDLLRGLANTLINVFSPLAKEKITKEMARHTDNPAVADQVTTGIIEAAKAITGKDDPIEAVLDARADPAMVQQIETGALETLERLAPLLDKIAGWERDARDATEASMSAAASRKNEQDAFLTRSIVQMTIGILIVLAALVGWLAWLKVTETVLMAVFGLFNAAAMLAVSKFGTRYDHAYGSSYGSSAKDVVVAELARRPAPPGRAG